MNQDTHPTTASANTAPKTLQEKSNVIERLAEAVIDHAKADDDGLCVVSMIHDEPRWWPELPEPKAIYYGDYAMHKCGILYECKRCPINHENFVWAVASDGLRRAIQQQPHTYGFAMMDSLMVAEHMHDVVRSWATLNFNRETSTAALHQLVAMIESRPINPDYFRSATEIRLCIDRFNRVAVLMLQRHGNEGGSTARGDALVIIHDGIRQALELAYTLLMESAALCEGCVKSPPEGAVPASSFLT